MGDTRDDELSVRARLAEAHLLLDDLTQAAAALGRPPDVTKEPLPDARLSTLWRLHGRLAFERSTIFPAAGLDPAGAAEYYDVLTLVDRLSYAGNEAARRYINGQLDAKGAASWLERYALYSPPRAEQRLRFIDQYRSYVINYNLGKDMVKRYVESNGGTASSAAKRWNVFEQLLSSPRLPSGLQ